MHTDRLQVADHGDHATVQALSADIDMSSFSSIPDFTAANGSESLPVLDISMDSMGRCGADYSCVKSIQRQERSMAAEYDTGGAKGDDAGGTELAAMRPLPRPPKPVPVPEPTDDLPDYPGGPNFV